MKILLTGSQGYIGMVLSTMLLEQGFEVTGLDSDLYKSCTFGSNIPNVPFINKDIRDVVKNDCVGYDAILHLAGLSNDPLGNLDRKLTFDINYKASVNLAKSAKAAGVRRFIFSSSCSNYGAGGTKMINEKAKLNPVTPYGISKVMVEKAVYSLADENFTPVFLRNATAYGFSPRIRFDLVLNNLVAWAFTTGMVYLKSDGSSWRPIVHVEDISRAFIAVLKAEKSIVHNQVFNVGTNSDNYQIKQIAQIVKETVPGCSLKFAPGASADKRCYRVDCSKLPNTIPSFKPKWNAKKGAAQLYQSYKKIGLKLEDFEGPKYQRIGHIKFLLKKQLINNSLRWIAAEKLSYV
ncbi:MAG: NAD(P)-dependent oxidoreductase [Phycisphaerae bacterium]|nr:NAD(P)-dependent oxidoreductase [Phycisphaerae bacterium]